MKTEKPKMLAKKRTLSKNNNRLNPKRNVNRNKRNTNRRSNKEKNNGNVKTNCDNSKKKWPHKDAKKTQEAYIEGFFTMGDMGYLDEDEYLFIVDRKSDMILSGGVNIYPAEIENTIFGHPAVLDVVVFGVPDEKWGEAIKAVVQLKEGQKATEEEITEWCDERLSSMKKPKSVDFIDELPRDINGKVYKRQIRDKYWEGRSTKIV